MREGQSGSVITFGQLCTSCLTFIWNYLSSPGCKIFHMMKRNREQAPCLTDTHGHKDTKPCGIFIKVPRSLQLKYYVQVPVEFHASLLPHPSFRTATKTCAPEHSFKIVNKLIKCVRLYAGRWASHKSSIGLRYHKRKTGVQIIPKIPSHSNTKTVTFQQTGLHHLSVLAISMFIPSTHHHWYFSLVPT